jgi:hypothetical protein
MICTDVLGLGNSRAGRSGVDMVAAREYGELPEGVDEESDDGEGRRG